MNLAAVMDDLGLALGAIPGLRVYPFSVGRVTPVAAVVLWPTSVDYDAAMVRGGDRITIPVVVIAGKLDERSARDVLAGFMDGAGPRSVKAAVEGYEGATSWDSVRVTTATPDSITSAGVEYLGATFDIDVIGKGA